MLVGRLGVIPHWAPARTTEAASILLEPANTLFMYALCAYDTYSVYICVYIYIYIYIATCPARVLPYLNSKLFLEVLATAGIPADAEIAPIGQAEKAADRQRKTTRKWYNINNTNT